MKIKFFKRFLVIVMSMLMLMATSTVVFAAHSTREYAEGVEEMAVMPRANTAVPAKSTVTLDMGYRFAGTSAEVTFVTACSKNDGVVNWKIYRGSVKVDSGSVGVNDMVPDIFYFSGGNYTIELTNTASAETTVYIIGI